MLRMLPSDGCLQGGAFTAAAEYEAGPFTMADLFAEVAKDCPQAIAPRSPYASLLLLILPAACCSVGSDSISAGNSKDPGRNHFRHCTQFKKDAEPGWP